MTAIPLADNTILNVKRALLDFFPRIKSAHLTEALASALGFKSHAALLAAIQTQMENDPEIVLLDKTGLMNRLAEIGVRVEARVKSAFSFENLDYPSKDSVITTCSPKYFKIDYTKSKRKRAWRNAMVAAINEGIGQKLFSVLPGDNRWASTPSNRDDKQEPYVFEFMVGNIPAAAYVGDAGFDELSIHVALWPKDLHWVPASNAGRLAGDVFAQGWLERKSGAWLQVANDVNSQFFCAKNRLDEVASLNIRPRGYADRGSFKL